MHRNNIIKIGCCGWLEGQKRCPQDFGVVEVQEVASPAVLR